VILPNDRYSNTVSRPVKPRKRVVETLTEVFRELGYEGASLSRLSEATGLKRASLYHRFPGGKQAMALAVLEHVAEAFQDDVLRPLSEQGDPAARVTRMGERLRSFYADGRLSCLLDTLSVGDADPAVAEYLGALARGWIAAMQAVALEAGVPKQDALRRAADAFAAVEGALVLARATGDRSGFERAIASLPERLTAPDPTANLPLANLHAKPSLRGK